MKILGLDSSGIVASVAIVEDENLIAEYTVNYKKTHSQTLLPMLDELVKMTELELDTIDAIAVAAGPGSFTGLRIGSATAKGLGLALKKPLVEIPTVDALAYNLYDARALICPIMDARRSQVYTGIYRFQEHKLQLILHLLLTECGCIIACSQILICLRVKFIIIDTIYNSPQAVSTGTKKSVKTFSIEWCLNLICICVTYCSNSISKDYTALQEITILVSFQLIRCKVII